MGHKGGYMLPISDMQIDKVRRLREAGKTAKEIAAETKMAVSSVWRILSGNRQKRGEEDPVITTAAGELPMDTKVPMVTGRRKLSRRTTVSGVVITATPEDDYIVVEIEGAEDEKLVRFTFTRTNFKLFCEDAAMMLEAMLINERNGKKDF